MKSWERRSEIRDIKNIARQDKKAQRKKPKAYKKNLFGPILMADCSSC